MDTYIPIVSLNAHQILSKERFKSVYSKVDAKLTVPQDNSGNIIFTLLMGCDMLNEVDLVIPNQDLLELNTMIKCIHVDINGCLIDSIVSEDDIETQIVTNCALYGRTLTQMNDKLFVPLVLSPFHSSYLIRPCPYASCVRIVITLKKHVDTSAWELYGNRFFLEGPGRDRILNKSHEYLITQNQRSYSDDCHSISLKFIHPLSLIYFWGFDKSKVQNVKLTMDGKTIYDGSLEALEYKKNARGLREVSPVFIFFSPANFNERPIGTANFDFKSVKLQISTNEPGKIPLHVVGINYQLMVFEKGVYRPIFQ